MSNSRETNCPQAPIPIGANSQNVPDFAAPSPKQEACLVPPRTLVKNFFLASARAPSRAPWPSAGLVGGRSGWHSTGLALHGADAAPLRVPPSRMRWGLRAASAEERPSLAESSRTVPARLIARMMPLPAPSRAAALLQGGTPGRRGALLAGPGKCRRGRAAASRLTRRSTLCAGSGSGLPAPPAGPDPSPASWPRS